MKGPYNCTVDLDNPSNCVYSGYDEADVHSRNQGRTYLSYLKFAGPHSDDRLLLESSEEQR